MKFRSCGRWARSRCSSADRYCSPQFVQEAKLCKDVLRPKARLTKKKLTEASKFCIQHGRASRHQIDHDPPEILSRGCFSSDVKDQNGGPGTIPVPLVTRRDLCCGEIDSFWRVPLLLCCCPFRLRVPHLLTTRSGLETSSRISRPRRTRCVPKRTF